MDICLRIFTEDFKQFLDAEYKNIRSYKVEKLTDKEIFDMGFDTVDKNGEYLTIEFENGETSMFRNSHIKLRRI